MSAENGDSVAVPLRMTRPAVGSPRLASSASGVVPGQVTFVTVAAMSATVSVVTGVTASSRSATRAFLSATRSTAES